MGWQTRRKKKMAKQKKYKEKIAKKAVRSSESDVYKVIAGKDNELHLSTTKPTPPSGTHVSKAFTHHNLMNHYDFRKKICFHRGNDLVVGFGKTHLYAGGLMDLDQYHLLNKELVFDLTGTLRIQPFVNKGPQLWLDIAKDNQPLYPPIVSIEWRDMGVPVVKPTFFIDAYENLPDGNVLIMCQGGHGRTGTFIACIMVASGLYTAEEAIDNVRDCYCDEAVETNDQELYVHEVEKAVISFFDHQLPATDAQADQAAQGEGLQSEAEA